MKYGIVPVTAALLFQSVSGPSLFGQSKDPGLRGPVKPVFMVTPIGGMSASESALFQLGVAEFRIFNSVMGGPNGPLNKQTSAGLGPRFNSVSCGECHVQPTHGGSSAPVTNQAQLVSGVNTDYGILAPGQTNPSFLQRNGPSFAVRFKYNPDHTRDGGVHQLFTISGRSDAPGCNIPQPDFATQFQSGNVSIRITTPTFGAGLIEAIPDSTILSNKNSSLPAKMALGISGHENRDPHNALIAKFGWKAQIRALRDFTAEAYRNEMGVTNDTFTVENDLTPACQFNSGLDDKPFQTPQGIQTRVDIVNTFMRFLAPPARGTATASVNNGQSVFQNTGCVMCHTPVMNTGSSTSPALANKPVNLYSDLLVHHMGQGLMDDIIQGSAGVDEFRTAPLWGLGQRTFFLHDGRTSDLKAAIAAHAGTGSEANQVVANWNVLTETLKQDLLNFLRSL